MTSYFITGASRGLGLDLVRALLARPATEVSVVYAGVRTQTDGIKELAKNAGDRAQIVSVDMDSEESVQQAVEQVTESSQSKGLDVLINVAGVMTHFPSITDVEDLNYIFNANVTGVHRVTRAFLPLLKEGTSKKVINYSSGLGSIGRAFAWAAQDSGSYKVAKAALNMLTVQYAAAFEKEGFTFIVLSPGWVKTDLGGEDADIDVKTSSKAVLEIVDRITPSDNGKFLNIRVPEFDGRPEAFQYMGDEIPW